MVKLCGGRVRPECVDRLRELAPPATNDWPEPAPCVGVRGRHSRWCCAVSRSFSTSRSHRTDSNATRSCASASLRSRANSVMSSVSASKSRSRSTNTSRSRTVPSVFISQPNSWRRSSTDPGANTLSPRPSALWARRMPVRGWWTAWGETSTRSAVTEASRSQHCTRDKISRVPARLVRPLAHAVIVPRLGGARRRPGASRRAARECRRRARRRSHATGARSRRRW